MSGCRLPRRAPLRDRGFSAAAWNDDPWYRGIRDAYLLGSAQMRRLVAESSGEPSGEAMANFLLDGWLNTVAPTNFAMTNPDVVARAIETGGANLAAGFAKRCYTCRCW